MQTFDFLDNKIIDLTTIKITGKRVNLVSINNDYREDIFREFTPEITRYMLPKPADDIEETGKFISTSLMGMKAGWNLVLVIKDRSSGAFLGCCGLHGEGAPRTPELGIWVKKSAHGHHYGLEAVKCLIAWVKHTLNTNYLIYPVDRANIPSRNIPETCGGKIFDKKRVKTMRGTYLEEVIYRIQPASHSLV